MRLSSFSFSPRWEKGHFAFWSFCFVVLFYSPCIFSIGVFGFYLVCLLAFSSSIFNSFILFIFSQVEALTAYRLHGCNRLGVSAIAPLLVLPRELMGSQGKS
jgi:hypothetical protein